MMKNINEEEILTQDQSQTADHPGMIFIIHLLMDECCEMPERQFMHDVMNKHLGKTECFAHDGEFAGFAPFRYMVHFEDDNKDVPPQLMIMKCLEIEQPLLDDIALSQIWNCRDGKKILEECKYHVVATDMMAAGLDYRERAEMLVKFIEALAEIYPSCKAFVFENSKKMMSREDIQNCALPEEDRFMHYAVNVRFFNIEGTEDKLIDSIGMNTLFLPDIQYHFHGVEPSPVVNHAYNMLSYIFKNDIPINSGDRIDGIRNGKMSADVQWTVQYEESLIQPIRKVIDVNMAEYAAGGR